MEYKELDTIKVGGRIKINDSIFTVQDTSFHLKTKDDEFHSDCTRIELDDEYVLEKLWGNWKFFQLITTKWFGFTHTKSKDIPINLIEIL